MASSNIGSLVWLLVNPAFETLVFTTRAQARARKCAPRDRIVRGWFVPTCKGSKMICPTCHGGQAVAKSSEGAGRVRVKKGKK